MSKSRTPLSLSMILMFLPVALRSGASSAHAGNRKDLLRADPRPLQLAADNPEATSMVFIQKAA